MESSVISNGVLALRKQEPNHYLMHSNYMKDSFEEKI